ncbi:MAG: ABC transporter substrate-binding protein [Burkholderiales bacterium]
MTDRRKLVFTLGAAPLAQPFGSLAQPQGRTAAATASRVWRIGFLTLPSRAVGAAYYAAFVQRLRELGYAEGSNLVVEVRSADGDVPRLTALAAELVQLKVNLIVAVGNQATSAAKEATTSIPIVMPITNDPVGNGYIASLGRPGGNITGLADISFELAPKRIEMLLAMTASKAPKVSRVAVLGPSDNPVMRRQMGFLQEASARLGVSFVPLYALTPEAIEQAFASMREQKATALMVVPHPFLVQQRNQIAQLALQHRLPVSAPYAAFAEAGCLLSYGMDPLDTARRAAIFVDRIFKGAKPADLPVEQPTTFELMINGRTANALGLTIPQELLISASKVFE